VRIKSLLSRGLAAPLLGLALGLGVAGLAAAQDNTTPQPGQFGPRAGKTGQPDAAGQTPPQAPKVEVVATHGKWKVQCEAGQAAGAQRSCGMMQATTNEKNPKAFLNVIILRPKAPAGQEGAEPKTEVRMLAPLGVFLPMGVALEIDGQAIGRVGYVRCMAQICMATGELKPETLTKLKKGNEANFIIYEAPGIGLPMKVSLDGFSAAIAELDKI
jgi:invasion protein IalB